MFAVVAGLAAGLLHVFSGPDHLAAIAPLAADGDRGQWRAGLQWGIGHTTGVLLIGLLLLLFSERCRSTRFRPTANGSSAPC